MRATVAMRAVKSLTLKWTQAFPARMMKEISAALTQSRTRSLQQLQRHLDRVQLRSITQIF
jgi:uncharacterized coiled-coil protein SlyX